LILSSYIEKMAYKQYISNVLLEIALIFKFDDRISVKED
jgi:hypothetical protein